MTREIAGLIHEYDELETRIGAAERAVNSGTMLPSVSKSVLQTATKIREEIRVVRLRLAAQGFFMSFAGKEAGVGE